VSVTRHTLHWYWHGAQGRGRASAHELQSVPLPVSHKDTVKKQLRQTRDNADQNKFIKTWGIQDPRLQELVNMKY
jgi:hypothetical protein